MASRAWDAMIKDRDREDDGKSEKGKGWVLTCALGGRGGGPRYRSPLRLLVSGSPCWSGRRRRGGGNLGN